MEDKDLNLEDDKFEKTRSDKEDEIYLQNIEKTAEGGVLPDAIPYEKKPKKDELEIEEPPMPVEEIIEEVIEEEPLVEEIQPEEPEEFEEPAAERNWEDPFEEEEENCAVKKYIFAVSKDYVNMIDPMDLDERSAYVNEAISLMIARDKMDAKKELKLNILRHIVIAVAAVIIGVPVMFYAVNKSIDITIRNYKYTQENFEKLYREKMKKDAIIKNSQDIIRDKEKGYNK